ncbi:ComF family protein [Dokdonia sinensis]|uniref:ComF family protein n=1 Tax=Dokdonia sinensis TaxID=2479847 RepID=A0A3M0G1L7_9FLAO|nr:phosphoribosyltransferase family protein [Dokdonia sinensis]RMB58027.1 ComF family protein [Dokdonia sinensis]
MFTSVRTLLFPDYCTACEIPLRSGEKFLCTSCRHQVPETNLHLYNDATIKKVFYGRLNLQLATSLFYFEKKGPIQKLMHGLKYKGKEHIGQVLGEWLGTSLATLPEYKKIDVVIPVPLHPKKMKKRGYNQVSAFAKALSTHLNAQYNDTVLVKSKNTQTQVFKGRFTRSDEVLNAFSITETQRLAGKHILLVDDIITTGATIEACGIELLKIPKITLSIATMAIAR